MSVVLVTGGAGYVGSHTVMALAEAGDDVVVFDDLSAGHIEAIHEIQAAVPAHPPAFVKGDIQDGAAVRVALGESGATAVMHFAARLLVEESVRDPLGYFRVNVTGTLTVLGAMAEAGVRRFILSSTAATFGEPERTPIDESHPQRPINPYGETKLAIERALPHIARATGLSWMALRYFNAAGAHPGGRIGEDHDPEEHLIPRAVGAALGGAPLTVHGDDYPTPDGTCIRDYVHVSDLAAAHLAALRALEAGAPSTAYNLGNGRGISVRQVLDSVARAAGRPVPHRIGPRRAGDPVRLVASSERISRELGWVRQFGDVDAIVRTAWRWHADHPAGYGR
jgi:UDP-glucose-4-epimerase GalE